MVTVPWDGSLLKKSSPYEMAALTNQLQRDSELPLIFAADFERGVSMRLNGGTVFPQAMALGATHNKNFAFLFGRITASWKPRRRGAMELSFPWPTSIRTR